MIFTTLYLVVSWVFMGGCGLGLCVGPVKHGGGVATSGSDSQDSLFDRLRSHAINPLFETESSVADSFTRRRAFLAISTAAGAAAAACVNGITVNPEASVTG